MATNLLELDHFDPRISTTCPLCQSHRVALHEIKSVYHDIIQERIKEKIALENRLLMLESEFSWHREMQRRQNPWMYHEDPDDKPFYEPENHMDCITTMLEVL